MDRTVTTTTGKRWATRRVWTALTLAWFALASVPQIALAQVPGRVPDEEGGAGLRWGVAIGCVVIVTLTGFMNPKRSHQD